MEQSEKHPGEKVQGHGVLRRILDKYIQEESKLDIFIKRAAILWTVGKFVLVIGGIFLIYKAAQVVGTVYTTIPAAVFKGLNKAAARFMPLFLDLIVKSLTYLWQPILAYLLIALLTKSKFWRKFWCLVGVAVFFLVFVSALEEFSWPVLEEFSWSALKEFGQSVLNKFSWEEYRVLPLHLMQGYLFTLWLVPREIWNIIGLSISLTLGLIILISPFDLPTAFDDFGMLGAILAFFLGYLNALANLLQRVVRRL